MDTKVFLIRHGVTDWHREGKLLGRRDIPLNADGIAQAQRAADGLVGIALAEVISSPLQRALHTAQIVARQFGIEVARDHRLIDFEVGHWSGMRLDDIAVTAAYREFLANPLSTHIPGGENLEQVRKRAVDAIEQALEDNPPGADIAAVTHSGVIRVLLAHYLGAPPATYHRLQVSSASISVLAFSDDQLPRVLTCNWSADRLAHLGRQGDRQTTRRS
ncbi:MAG: histidine phosphatase family protein [Proteobacteria bacterium]|nr:histidine phosphatase family protein [Pseudomonadota bacterium]